jgi:hypothetical protein
VLFPDDQPENIRESLVNADTIVGCADVKKIATQARLLLRMP